MPTFTDLIKLDVEPRKFTGLVGGGVTKLDGLVTVDQVLSPIPFVQFTLADVLETYFLDAGTDATSSPGVIRPTDYAPSTNEKVWRRIRCYTMAEVDALIAALPGDASGIGSPEGVVARSVGSFYTDLENANADPLLSHLVVYIKISGGSTVNGWQLFQAT